jgi:hypothetical protein
VRLKNDSVALILSLYVVVCAFLLILWWALSLRKTAATLIQVNQALFAKAQWESTFRQEMRGEQE